MATNIGVTMRRLLIGVLAVVAMTLTGCASRADWQAGLEQAQTISDTAGSEIGRVRQVIADIVEDLDAADPQSQFAADLRRELERAQDQLAILHQQKQIADQKIEDYRQRLASIPDGASDLDLSLYMIGEGAKDISRIVPSPVGEILFGAGVLLAGVSSAGWRRATANAKSKDHTLKATVHALEVARESDPDLKSRMHANEAIIHAAMGPDVRQVIDTIRKGA